MHLSRIDLESGEQTILSQHTSGVSSVAYSPEHGWSKSGQRGCWVLTMPA